jgi:hypothetical protein
MLTSQPPLRLQAQEREDLPTVVRTTRSGTGWARQGQLLLLPDKAFWDEELTSNISQRALYPTQNALVKGFRAGV